MQPIKSNNRCGCEQCSGYESLRGTYKKGNHVAVGLPWSQSQVGFGFWTMDEYFDSVKKAPNSQKCQAYTPLQHQSPCQLFNCLEHFLETQMYIKRNLINFPQLVRPPKIKQFFFNPPSHILSILWWSNVTILNLPFDKFIDNSESLQLPSIQKYDFPSSIAIVCIDLPCLYPYQRADWIPRGSRRDRCGSQSRTAPNPCAPRCCDRCDRCDRSTAPTHRWGSICSSPFSHGHVGSQDMARPKRYGNTVVGLLISINENRTGHVQFASCVCTHPIIV